MAKKGHIVTLEHREKIRNAMLGKKHTQMTKDFMSRSAMKRRRNNGKFAPEEKNNNNNPS